MRSIDEESYLSLHQDKIPTKDIIEAPEFKPLLCKTSVVMSLNLSTHRSSKYGEAKKKQSTPRQLASINKQISNLAARKEKEMLKGKGDFSLTLNEFLKGVASNYISWNEIKFSPLVIDRLL